MQSRGMKRLQMTQEVNSQRGAAWWAYLLPIVAAALVLAILIPNMLETRATTPPWYSTVTSLRLISEAQELYNARYSTYAMLDQLRDTRMIDPVLASATTPLSPKFGYYFTLTLPDKRSSWRCVARPAVWGADSEHPRGEWRTERNYLITEQGVIYYNATENSSEFTRKLGEP
jgi:hypothetical protein